jgi:hypothetical protein
MHKVPLLIEPDADDPGCATILVDGAVEAIPRRFLLDTGAALTCCKLDEVTAEFPVSGASSSSALFAAQDHDVIQVADVAIGGRSWSGPLTITRERQPTQLHDILGMDILGRCSCDFDFPAARLVLDGPPSGITGNPLTTDSAGHPYVDVEYGDAVATAVWDSGASMTVVDKAFVAAYPGHFTEVAPTMGTDAAGVRSETATFRMGAVDVGGQHLGPSTVAAVDLAPLNATVDVAMDMIVGYPLLAQARWVFDFPAKRWGAVPVQPSGRSQS